MSDNTGQEKEAVTMDSIEIGDNGSEPVTRRECAMTHTTTMRDLRGSIRQLQWFVGITISVLVTMVVLGVNVAMQSVPKDIPPAWFVSRVERLETSLTLRIERLENKIEKMTK